VGTKEVRHGRLVRPQNIGTEIPFQWVERVDLEEPFPFESIWIVSGPFASSSRLKLSE
jgi:hypothetical protein